MSGSRQFTPGVYLRLKVQSYPTPHSYPQADQLLQYLKAQRQYTTLLERYNPGMNMDEEERVRLTARRVGMDLPIEYEKASEKN